MAGVFATLLQMIGQADATGKLFIPEGVLRDFWMDGKPPLNSKGRWCPQLVKMQATIDLIKGVRA